MASSPSKPKPHGTPTHVALLRGINVGGKHMVPMAALTVMFEDAGCTGIRTYIQSGNVVFAATPASAKRVAGAVAEQIEKRFDFRPLILVRTSDEFTGIARKHPFLNAETDPATLHVGFLSSAPDAKLIARLDPARSPGDRFAVRGREIYVHFANGVLKTKLTGPYIDSVLSTTSSFRNWRTVLKLAEMVRTPLGV